MVSIYYRHDANFNITAVTDDTGAVLERYAYSPYGQVAYLDDAFAALSTQESAIDNEYLYTGRRLDPGAPGLQLNRHRFYASHVGRWVNRDPVEYNGGRLRRKVRLNISSFALPIEYAEHDIEACLYCYTGNRPLIGLDPQALWFGYDDIFTGPADEIGYVLQ